MQLTAPTGRASPTQPDLHVCQHVRHDGAMTTWDDMRLLPRQPAAGVRRRDIPAVPGVYTWWRGGKCVYVGEAKTSLKVRLWTHFGLSPDFSRSTLRRTVALVELGVPRAVSEQRPTVITQGQADVVNAWLRECDVAWLECGSADEAHAVEAALRAEALPPLNRS